MLIVVNDCGRIIPDRVRLRAVLVEVVQVIAAAALLLNLDVAWELPVVTLLSVLEDVDAVREHLIQRRDSQGLCHVQDGAILDAVALLLRYIYITLSSTLPLSGTVLLAAVDLGIPDVLLGARVNLGLGSRLALRFTDYLASWLVVELLRA